MALVTFGTYFLFQTKDRIGESEAPVLPPEVIGIQDVSLRGMYICLPHKDTSGPVTMECALGLQAEDGMFYGLDTGGLPGTTPPDIQTGNRILVEGRLVPIEMLSTDFWFKYGVKGIIQVSKMEKIN